MPASLLTLNTAVPPAEHPGTPAIVIFDNGDWEIAYKGDTDYIAEGSDSYVGYVTFIDFFVSMMIFFDIGDVDDLDVSGDRVNLFIEERVNHHAYDEPVLLIWDDGESDVMERCEAESILKTDPEMVTNFIAAVDLFADFCVWRSRVGDDLWDSDIESEEPDEDADPEDI
jgi:hypothetical protein